MCWNLWQTVLKDEMQQTDALCGQTGFSGTPWQDATRARSKGGQSHTEKRSWANNISSFCLGKEEGKTTPLLHEIFLKQTSVEALLICVLSSRAHTDFKSSIIEFGRNSQSQTCYFTFRS